MWMRAEQPVECAGCRRHRRCQLWREGLGRRSWTLGGEQVGLMGEEGKKLKDRPRKGCDLWRVNQLPTSISRCSSSPHRFKDSKVFISL